MGGNIVDSRPGIHPGWAGTLLGPEGTAAGRKARLVLLVPGSDPRRIPPVPCRGPGLLCLMAGSGFGGVFVNWIVDASI
jgi:hypothetical protein